MHESARVAAPLLKLDRPGALRDRRGRALEVTRLDLLVSGFELQRADGTWTDATGWHAFFSAAAPARRQALRGAQAPAPSKAATGVVTGFATGVNPGRYVAARFRVGVDREANHANPNRLAADDPLHPVVNGLHWGWAGGYVFLAVEGHWQPDHAPAGSSGGFSYHLAGDENLVDVKLAAPITVGDGSVLRLHLDARRLLASIDIARDGDSTHSRRQDAAVLALRAALPRVFTLEVIDGMGDGVGDSARVAAGSVGRSGAAGDPYPLEVGAHMPRLTWPDDNVPTVAGVALGEVLFNDARLSRDSTVSCASCHRAPHAMADGGRSVSRGVDGREGTRNAMPIFNLAWVGEFFWDGRAKRLRDQALVPIQDAHEMAETLPRVVAKLAADPAMVRRFRAAFDEPSTAAERGRRVAVTASRVALALEQFMLTRVSQDSKFDRVTKGVERFTPQEQRGFELFLTEHDPANGLRGADCFHCHGGSLFTNQRFVNNGLPLRHADAGRERVTRDAADRGRFRVPSLRNVAVTGPYMHDGRFATLEEVVEHYDRGVQRGATLDPNLAKHPPEGLRLSNDDKAALVAFMRTLTEAALAPRAPAASPAVVPALR